MARETGVPGFANTDMDLLLKRHGIHRLIVMSTYACEAIFVSH